MPASIKWGKGQLYQCCVFVSSGPPSITPNTGDTPEMAILSVNHNWRFVMEPLGPERLQRERFIWKSGDETNLPSCTGSPRIFLDFRLGMHALAAACVQSGREQQFITHDKWLDVISSLLLFDHLYLAYWMELYSICGEGCAGTNCEAPHKHTKDFKKKKKEEIRQQLILCRADVIYNAYRVKCN